MRSSDVSQRASEMPNSQGRERLMGPWASLTAERLERSASLSAKSCLLPEVLDQMEAHALSESGEVCGLIFKNRYFPLRNVSPFVSRRFFADPVELAHGLFLYGEPLAIFHTHPSCNLELSTEDRKLWYYRNSTMIVGCIDDGRLRWKIYGNRGD